MIPEDFDYRARPAGGPLAPFVESVWYAKGQISYARERILPMPKAVVLVIVGPAMRMTPPRPDAEPVEMAGAWLTGPHERPILNEPSGATHVVGAVLAVGGVSAFLDDSADTVTNRIVRLEDAAPRLGPDAELTGRLGGAAPHDAIDALEGWLGARCRPLPDHDVWDDAFRRLVTTPEQPVKEIQERLAVSRRHFVEQVRRRVGLTPKSVQRLSRMRRLIDELDARKPIRWSCEALGAGYFDQPHAIRDFRAFTGMTPTEYVERRRLAWGDAVEPGEATNFVPELVR